MMNKRINIAIDGPSGVGKSSVAKLLAKQLGFFFISSGSLYRLSALLAIENNIDVNDAEKIVSLWNFEDVRVDSSENWFYKERNVTINLRDDEVSTVASNIAVFPSVREKIVKFLQWYSESFKGVIIDGRDATYRILPNAELKIFLWAKAEIRAQRRMLQNLELGHLSNYEEVLAQIKARDYQDSTRKEDPLKVSEGSIEIDSTNMSILEVYEKIYELAINKINEVK
ncbi:(d)CMP kinase [Mycoplasma zalophi]|uniref:Cytidylate kinase n=1 Tax=Mycoplasma zalophi TaxID=191287 RepID=A0ABS6DR70_9MOLU|nr:(d)CMP kinase [Mycoplasma zalophi]MBU4690742.1 (d)CMP kinase [Mycoplasma zalophi]MBU4692442.1 (d)CMP kinase [Mycoplasma zalophi]